MLRSLSMPALAAALALGVAGCAESTDERPAEFGYIVTTILAPSCGTATCHNSMTRREGYAFDTIEEARETFRVNPLVTVIDEPDANQLIFITTREPDKRMPLDSPLPDADIELMREWIRQGAVR